MQLLCTDDGYTNLYTHIGIVIDGNELKEKDNE